MENMAEMKAARTQRSAELQEMLATSQEQVESLSIRLAMATERLNEQQAEADDKLGRISGNTAAKPKREVKSL